MSNLKKSSATVVFSDLQMKNLVSVIIPTYNRSALLKEAIESVIAQTYGQIECIVVDDGSTDDSKAVVEKLAETVNDDFILKYIYQTNAGSQVARNTGTKASTGEYIQYLDSDDLLYPVKIEQQVKYLQQHEGCDGVFGDWENGTEERSIFISAYKGDDLIRQMVTLEKSIANFSIILRKSLVEKIGEWDVKLKRCQEIDYHLRGLLLGADYDYQSQNTGLWRFHDGDRIMTKTNAYDFVFFFKKWEGLLKDKGLWKTGMAIAISKWYMWLCSQENLLNDHRMIDFLQEVVRLNPAISFYNTQKMKLLRRVLGKRKALKIWVFQSQNVRNKYLKRMTKNSE